MSQGSTTRREEDELLKYAYVEAHVQKHYAFRYRGYTDEIPWFFIRRFIGNPRLRDKRDEVEFRTGPNRDVVKNCKIGDWIVVSNSNDFDILSDNQFRHLYKSVTDLSF